MRLLLYNPNTNQSLTAGLAAAVRMRLAPRDALLAITSETGEAFVNSEDSIAGARASASATLRGPAGECDAILLGCFGDLGVDELRRELKRPIVSLSDAFLSVAPLASRRIGVVTTSLFWADRIKAEARLRGASGCIADIRSLEVSADAEPVAVEEQCRATIADLASGMRCDAVILGGAALVALIDDLSAGSPLPIVDPLALGIILCRAASEVLTSARDS